MSGAYAVHKSVPACDVRTVVDRPLPHSAGSLGSNSPKISAKARSGDGQSYLQTKSSQVLMSKAGCTRPEEMPSM
jgi:hypothetical protein